jgi:predicted small metal-binding protein
MSSTVNCDCGEVIRAETDDELVSAVGAHVERDHPELVGKLGRDDILAMAEVDEE